MREIKFRAYYKPEYTMLDWEFLQTELNHYNKPFVDTDDYKVMQYTGLKDKNGVEIYDGDIVRLKTGAIGFYEYSEPHLAFAVRLKEHDCGGDDFIISKLDGWYNFDVEVIGNIYENPELLKEED